MRNAPKFPTPPEGADLFTWIVRVAAEVRAARQGQAAIARAQYTAAQPPRPKDYVRANAGGRVVNGGKAPSA